MLLYRRKSMRISSTSCLKMLMVHTSKISLKTVFTSKISLETVFKMENVRQHRHSDDTANLDQHKYFIQIYSYNFLPSLYPQKCLLSLAYINGMFQDTICKLAILQYISCHINTGLQIAEIICKANIMLLGCCCCCRHHHHLHCHKKERRHWHDIQIISMLKIYESFNEAAMFYAVIHFQPIIMRLIGTSV